MSSNTLFYGLSNVARNALFEKEFKPHQRATMASLNAFFSSLFFSIVAVFIGLVADQLKPAKALFIFQILAFSITWL